MFYYNIIDFATQKVLKSELLQQQQKNWQKLSHLMFCELSDGIIKGCQVKVGEGQLRIEPGILKYHHKIYQLNEELKVDYEHTGNLTFLRVRFLEGVPTEFGTQFATEIVLTEQEEGFPYEMELGRFIAEKGAKLYFDDTSYEQLLEQYNHFDIRYVPYAGKGRTTISSKLTTAFGKELFQKKTDNVYDIAFAMECMGGRTVERNVIEQYIQIRNNKDMANADGGEICMELWKILKQQRERKDMSEQKNHRRMIIE